MSSHHFVKEGQEPALFIVDALSLSLVEPLLEWAPLVVVADRALDEVLRWGIKVDVVLSPVDKLMENQEKVIDQLPVQVALYLPGDDLLKEGILFLISARQKAVNIVAKLNDEYFRLSKIFPQFQIAIMNQELKWIFHDGGIFSKWLTARTRIYIQKDFSNQPLTTHGLHEGNDYFEVLQDGLVSIQSDGSFWVGELIQ